MNKIQLIKLLENRGISEIKGISVAEAIRQSGGDPTNEEMVKVNEQAMNFYIGKHTKNIDKIKKLEDLNVKLEKRCDWLDCLEDAGVDNWQGYDTALDMQNERIKN